MGDHKQIEEVILLFRRRRRLIAAGALLAAVFFFYVSLPSPLFSDPFSTILVSGDGELLNAKISDDGQWRFPELATVPEKFKTAIIAYEDKRFYSHPGVDPFAFFRAVYLNLKNKKIVSGGSTINMQLIRLVRKNPERTYLEKFIEMFLAVRLETTYDKDDVLRIYSSHAPFGGNVVGLEAAAWRYFGRSPENLSWAETCTLAVLPNSPALIHPGRNAAELKKKRDVLLKTLHERGHIANLDYELALLEPLPGKPVPLPQLAPHLLETVLSENGNEAARFESTIDSALQKDVNAITLKHATLLYSQDIDSVAVIVVDNERFEVLAYVGNGSVVKGDESGRLVDIVRRGRSTGSILKPFLFAAMLQSGDILPGTLVPDLPTQYSGYMPENFDRNYRGAVRAKDALARSLNVPSVRMLQRYGVDRFYAFLKHAGMTTLGRRPEEYGLTLILGGAEGTLYDMTTMYANLAYIARQNDYSGKLNYRKLKTLKSETVDTGRSVEIEPGSAWLTLSALEEVSRPDEAAFWKNFSSSRKIAWKTGTSYGLRDGWSIGSDTRYTVGVWVGNAGGQGRADLSGVGSAAPLMFAIFNRLNPSPWFEPPQKQLKEVTVCKDDGFLAANECEEAIEYAPLGSHFEEASPNHTIVHLDKKGRWRVHGLCEMVTNMKHKTYFVLPPGEEFYYKKFHQEYKTLPPYRKDCYSDVVGGKKGPIDFLYPNFGTRLYIPVDLDGRKGRTVFEAVHRDKDATLHWHLDDSYIGSTNTFHQMALDISPGEHVITVVDAGGSSLSRRFEVIGKVKAEK